MKKAQMFIITMVFLAGLAFFVHQLLISYSDIDLSIFPKNDDYYMIKNIVDIVNESVISSDSCEEALNRIWELHRITGETEGKYIITVSYNKRDHPHLFCNTFINSTGNKTALVLDIHVISGYTETESSFVFYK